MRIQDTNRILNESKILRSQHHEEEVAQSRWEGVIETIRDRVPSVLRHARAIGGLTALMAAGAGGALYLDHQRRSRSRRWW